MDEVKVYKRNPVGKRKMNMILRPLQMITGIHRVHHIVWSFGYKIPFLKIGYFHYRDTGFKKMEGRGIDYHDCTRTGVY